MPLAGEERATGEITSSLLLAAAAASLRNCEKSALFRKVACFAVTAALVVVAQCWKVVKMPCGCNCKLPAYLPRTSFLLCGELQVT